MTPIFFTVEQNYNIHANNSKYSLFLKWKMVSNLGFGKPNRWFLATNGYLYFIIILESVIYLLTQVYKYFYQPLCQRFLFIFILNEDKVTPTENVKYRGDYTSVLNCSCSFNKDPCKGHKLSMLHLLNCRCHNVP